MDAVVALVRPGPDRRAIEAALAGVADVYYCEHVGDLSVEVAAHRPVIVLAELTDPAGRDQAPTLTAFRHRMPWVPLCLYASLTVPDVRRVTELVARGVALGVAFRGAEPLRGALAELLGRAHATGETAAIRNILAPLIPPDLRQFLDACVHASVGPCTAHELARRTGAPLRVLKASLRHAGLPTAHRIASWCRVLRAGLRLAQSSNNTKVIAAALGYASVSALRMHLRHLSGLTFADLQRPGGHQHLIARLIAEFRSTDHDSSYNLY